MGDMIARGMAANALSEQTKFKLSTDFVVGSSPTPWSATNLNSGTMGSATAVARHPGVAEYMSSTTANSGFYYLTSSNSIQLTGGEKSTCVFKTAASQTSIVRRIGFHESTSTSLGGDGVYASIVDGVLTGMAVTNYTASNTATTYALAPATWYRFVVELNEDGTKATFTLYADDSDTVLWTDSLTTNIPTGAGRTTRHGELVYSTGTVAIALGQTDYMDLILNGRKV